MSSAFGSTSYPSSTLISNRHSTGTYLQLAKLMRDHGPKSLCNATSEVDFFRDIDATSQNVSFRDAQHKEYLPIICGEIGTANEGTAISARGGFNPGTLPHVRYIDNKAKVKFTLALRCPTGAPEILEDVFIDQLVTLNVVRAADRKAEKEHILLVHTKPIYENPSRFNSKRSSANSSRPTTKSYDKPKPNTPSSSTTEPPQVATALDLDTRHDPHVLPDYGGPLFTHTNAKLVQLNIRDQENQLIPPAEWYDALRPGTLVIAQVELHTYVLDDDQNVGEFKKCYQLSARNIIVVDPSDTVVIPRYQPTLNKRMHQNESTDTDDDDLSLFIPKRTKTNGTEKKDDKADKDDKGEGSSKTATTGPVKASGGRGRRGGKAAPVVETNGDSTMTN